MIKEVTFEQLNKADNILIWGAGYHTEEVLRFYKSFWEKKQIWITDKNKAGQFVAGYKIQAASEIDYMNIELVVIMSALYHGEIENTLRHVHNYQGSIVGLYAFRQRLLELDSYEECCCYLEDFIRHMEEGRPSYSYDYIFKEKFAHYKKIKLFAWWASSIGEAIRWLSSYYYNAFRHKPEDEYYLLVPYINGSDFANGRFMEIVSHTMPVITYENCHFWEYLFKRYPERFDYESFNDFNALFVDAGNPFDPKLRNDYFCDVEFPVITYTQEEEREAACKLKEMGISGEFVCIFARDSAYIQSQTGNSAYSCYDRRDMDIGTFEKAQEYLASKGIKSVRMGKVVGQPVELPNCIDYASEYHSDLMDIYLHGKCKFCAGNASGIICLAQLQSVPTLMLGVVQIGGCNALAYRSDDIYVPKKVYSKKINRILNFVEMWDAEMAANANILHYYQDQELEFIECSQEEIREAIIEMNEKIDGTYMENEQEKELQKRYHVLLNNWIEKHGYYSSYFLHCNISGSFIKKNEFLLEEQQVV